MDNPIPEEYRRKALYAALYHHDRVKSAGGADRDGESIRVEFRVGLGRIPEARRHRVPDLDEARTYVKRVAGALGYSFASEGPHIARLRPDVSHALDGLRNEYPDDGEREVEA